MTAFWQFELGKQFFKVKSVFKVPVEPKRALPEEKIPKLKPKKEEEPPARGIPTFFKNRKKHVGTEASLGELGSLVKII